MNLTLADGCRVRNMTLKDLDDLTALLSDPEVMRFIEPPFDRARTEAFLRRYALGAAPSVYALADADDRLIGQVIFHPWDEALWEIGWILAKRCWGRGLAQRVTEALIAECRRCGIAGCVLECDPTQGATKHIAQKLGFEYVGEEDSLDRFSLYL